MARTNTDRHELGVGVLFVETRDVNGKRVDTVPFVEYPDIGSEDYVAERMQLEDGSIVELGRWAVGERSGTHKEPRWAND